jgi:hypothetical protein
VWFVSGFVRVRTSTSLRPSAERWSLRGGYFLGRPEGVPFGSGLAMDYMEALRRADRIALARRHL